jgi:hypothetical protein
VETRAAIAGGETLMPGHDYLLETQIGPAVASSAVTNAWRNSFPENLIDEDAPTLDVVVHSAEFGISAQRHPLVLPPNGATETLTIGVRTPDHEGNASIRILVYHRNNCLMSQLLRAYVGGKGRGYQVIIDYVLTADSSQLDALNPQALAMHCAVGADGSFRLAVHGDDHDMFTAPLREDRIREAANMARYAMLDVHFGIEDGPSRYDGENSRSPAECCEDLSLLASRGWTLYQNAIGDADRRAEFRQLLRTTSRVEGRAASIQIAIAGAEVVAFPWQLVYDIPITSQATSLTVCPALAAWMSGGRVEIPSVCPLDHPRNTLCPFGFWGYAYELATPLSATGGSQALVVRRAPARRTTALAAISEELDGDLSAQHLVRLKERVAVFESRDADSLEQMLRLMPDLVYFYCHGKREPIRGASGQRPLLEIGTSDRIAPEDVLAWADGWPPIRWTDPRPLVVMNGCHTSELTPELLTDFVSAFGDLDASGAIGTEIALTQPIAGEAFEWLLAALLDGHGVAAAVRRMRWRLLRKGNVMGLAYTPYCYGGLRLRAAEE